MAKRVVNYVVLIDDLDGTELPRGEGQTIRYGWRGNEYEIDLSDKHANDLDAMMGNLVSKSVKVGRLPGPHPKKKQTPALSSESQPALPPAEEKSRTQLAMERRDFLREIREWANGQGIEQAAAGRLSEATRTAWDAAHPDRPCPPEAPSTGF
jgi:hypothetical protein